MNAVSQRFVAVMKDPDEIRANPIHSTSVAKDYGFRGALVGGATVYGWATRTILEALGEAWLDHGWVDVRFRRPVYPDDALTFTVSESGAFSVSKNADNERCLEGNVGLGAAPWLETLSLPAQTDPVPPADPLPALTPENLPVGQDLLARSVTLDAKGLEAYLSDMMHDDNPVYQGHDGRGHPGWLAEQPIHWLHHSFSYGPAIHTSSHIQHLGRLPVPIDVVVRGRCVDGYERKGHHYIVNDTEISTAAGDPVARIRHTAIYRVAKRG